MESIKEIFRIGIGPSSSHTMGPQKAATIFAERHKDASSFNVILYGSLAATGRGHMTDIAIEDVLRPIAPVEISWRPKTFLPFHDIPMRISHISFQSPLLFFLLLSLR